MSDGRFFQVELDFWWNDVRFLSLTPTAKLVYLCLWAEAVRQKTERLLMGGLTWRSLSARIGLVTGLKSQGLKACIGSIAHLGLVKLGLEGGLSVCWVVGCERKHFGDKGFASVEREVEVEVEREDISPTPLPGGADEKPPPKRRRKKVVPEEAPQLPLEEAEEPAVTGQTIIASWIDWCRSVRDIDPVVSGKDRAAAKRLLEFLQTPEDVDQVMELFLHDNDFFCEKVGWDLWALESRINGYRDGDGWRERDDDRPCYDQPYEGYGRGVEDPEPDRGRGESDFKAIGEI